MKIKESYRKFKINLKLRFQNSFIYKKYKDFREILDIVFAKNYYT